MAYGKNDVYLLVGNVSFANKSSRDPFVFHENKNAMYLGSFVYDREKSDAIGVLRNVRNKGTETRVERADQKIQVRDGRSRSNALGKNRDGSGDKLFRANGKAVK